MVDNQEKGAAPTTQKTRNTDIVASKIFDKVDKAAPRKDGDEEKKGPAGGFDDTPISKAPPGYTLKFTFHKAVDLPFADINTLSSDPYVLAQLNTDLRPRHKQDPYLRFRSRTIRRNCNPEWENSWIVANVPASGFELKVRIYDEDPGDHDDRLGDVTVHVDGIGESWDGIKAQSYKIKKKKGSKRAYFFRGCAAFFNHHIHMSGELYLSVELLGRTDAESGGRVYTLGPCNWTKHISPLIGRLAGTKDPEQSTDGTKKKERYDFQANQFQLQGPVPEKLYHRYVEFKPFVQGMFTSTSIRGRILNRALHHQHARIYNFDRSTIYGSFPEPCREMTLKFLDLVHYDEGGRIFTYILSLDGQWRFTETGKDFGIDLLSKHTMHSDVSIYIAFSGEFFVRRLSDPHKEPSEQEEHPPKDVKGGAPDEDPPKDPAYYHLVIDNDSGTYRPNADLLPLLKEFLQRNLPGLKISTLDCNSDKEQMDKMKSEQRERRKTEGKPGAFVQAGGSFDSSGGGANGGGVNGGKIEQKLQKGSEVKNGLKNIVHGGTERREREEREEQDDTSPRDEKSRLMGGGGGGGPAAAEATTNGNNGAQPEAAAT